MIDLDIWMSTTRIETLVDDIFVISMTLLVLSIGILTFQEMYQKLPFNNK
jgi:uncharacterized membrane protein